MNKLIDRFADTVPASQARIALEILKDGRDAGSITTIDEYNSALKGLIENSSRKNPMPFIKLLYPILMELSNSGDFTYVLRTIEADLRTIFTETESIMRLIRAHFEIFQNSMLKDLAGAVEKLEQEIEVYRRANIRQNNPFQKTQVTTFTDVNDARKVLADQRQALTGSLMDYEDNKEF